MWVGCGIRDSKRYVEQEEGYEMAELCGMWGAMWDSRDIWNGGRHVVYGKYVVYVETYGIVEYV